MPTKPYKLNGYCSQVQKSIFQGEKNSYQREKKPQKCKCQNQRQAEAVTPVALPLQQDTAQKKKFKKKNWLAIETAQD